ncbi:MAG: M17 family peptidase N-terminal domain-containing protein, partial [Gemmatimonadales bacterium]
MPFESTVVGAAPAGYDTPLLAIAVARGSLPPSLAELDRGAGGAVGRLLTAGDFTGKRDEIALLYPPGPAARVLLVGLGKPEDISRTAIRRAASTAAKRARNLGVTRAAFHLPKEARGGVSPLDAGQAIAEGLA